MNALEDKQIGQPVFAELTVSNAKPFVDLMADDQPGARRYRAGVIPSCCLNALPNAASD